MDVEVVFIFVKNLDYREINIGSGVFRHTESPTIRDIKELIRNTYNEKKDNKRDENHVVHASDNISQTDSILKYLGSKDSIEHFLRNDNTVFPVPYHIEEVKNYCIKNIDMSRVMCNIIMSPNRTKVIPIQETPHYSLLTGEYHLYEEYLNKYGGLLLKDDYSIEKFLKLSKTMKYLDPPYESNYILLKKRRDGVFQVLDGVHRTCILKYNGYENFIGALLQT